MPTVIHVDVPNVWWNLLTTIAVWLDALPRAQVTASSHVSATQIIHTCTAIEGNSVIYGSRIHIMAKTYSPKALRKYDISGVADWSMKHDVKRGKNHTVA